MSDFNELIGDTRASRTLSVGRRLNIPMIAETLAATKALDKDIEAWLKYNMGGVADHDVVLPNATLLSKEFAGLIGGWEVVIHNVDATKNILVKTYHATTPILLKTVAPGRAYSFRLTDNTTAAGEWHSNFLEEADGLVAPKFTLVFNATTDWGAAAGGFYTQTIGQSTHTRGAGAVALVEKLDGADYRKISVPCEQVTSSKDIFMKVPESPDSRFAGRIIII